LLSSFHSGDTSLGYFRLFSELFKQDPGNTKGESITVLLTSCLTGLD
jgi:hypothetical protein